MSSRMDNPETHVLHWAQNTERRHWKKNTMHQAIKMSNT